ncbi:MAG TPA: hypothetical protein VK400_03335, partial [Pyrinomonadaceae bacterium]|nr:hypothetical protein [Pyrinomonadaceae bacterium]
RAVSAGFFTFVLKSVEPEANFKRRLEILKSLFCFYLIKSQVRLKSGSIITQAHLYILESFNGEIFSAQF